MTRLIDADALKKAINDNGCRHSHYFEIFDVIDNAPTVEERPHGKWIAFDLTFGRNFYYCTVCKETEDLPPTRWFKFCPNCGADMREADNEQ